MMGPHQTIGGFRRDNQALKGKRLERDVLRRVWGFARPYRGQLLGFLVMVILAAIAGALSPCPSLTMSCAV